MVVMELIFAVEFALLIYLFNERSKDYINTYKMKEMKYVASKTERADLPRIPESVPQAEPPKVFEDPSLLLPAIGKASAVKGFGAPNKS